MSAKTPLLSMSDLTGRIYIVTEYTETDHGGIIAKRKHDVTKVFDQVARDRAEYLMAEEVNGS